MFHLIIRHGWPGREKDVCIGSSADLALLRESYLNAKSMSQYPRIYETDLMPPMLDKLRGYKEISID